jgi:hypothetical protein
MAAEEAVAHGRRPFDSKKVSGSYAVQACEVIDLMEPTSVASMVSRGKRARRVRVSS